MVSSDELGAMFGQMFQAGILEKLLTYLGYTLVAILCIGTMVAVYFLVQYRYKVIYPKILYDSDGQSAQIIGYKKDRARIVRMKNGTRYGQLLMSRRKIEPFRPEDIKPRNIVPILRINEDGTYRPMPSLVLDRISVGHDIVDGKKVQILKNEPVQFEYLTNEEKDWAILELKESATANTSEDAAKRILTYTLIAVFIMVAGAVLLIWLVLAKTDMVISGLDNLGPSLSNIAGSIGGAPK